MDNYKAEQLLEAISDNQPEQLETLLNSGVSVDSKIYFDMPLLHFAVLNDRHEIALLLLKRGADYQRVYEMAGKSYTALSIAEAIEVKEPASKCCEILNTWIRQHELDNVVYENAHQKTQEDTHLAIL